VTQHLSASVEKNQTAKTRTYKNIYTKHYTPVEANKFSDAAILRPALGQIGNTVRLIPPVRTHWKNQAKEET
jgi:hypothetical protein